MNISTFTLLTSYFEKKRSFALGFANVGFGVGSFITPFLITYVYDSYSFSGTWLIIAGLMSNLCAVALTFRPYHGTLNEGFEKTGEPVAVCNGHEEQDGLQLENPPAVTKEDGKTGLCQIITGNLTFYLLLVSLAFWCTGVSSIQVLILGLAEEHGIKSSEHTMILSIMAIVDTAFMIPIGLVLDLPRVKPFRKYVYCSLMMYYGICIFFSAFLKDLASFTAIAALQAVAKESIFCQLTAVIADMFGMECMVKTYGISIAVMGMAYLAWPIVVGK